GLKRRGFDADRIAAIRRAYRAVYMSGEPLEAARERLAELAGDSEDVRRMLDFIEGGDRPLLRRPPAGRASRWSPAKPPATCSAPAWSRACANASQAPCSRAWAATRCAPRAWTPGTTPASWR